MNCDYVAFEGIDGSGKSSIIEQLSKILDENKTENKIVREPGGTKVGEGIRELLLSHDYTNKKWNSTERGYKVT